MVKPTMGTRKRYKSRLAKEEVSMLSKADVFYPHIDIRFAQHIVFFLASLKIDL